MKQWKKTYTDDVQPMNGHTTLVFSFEFDWEKNFQLQLRITETPILQLLRIEICWHYVSKQNIEIPRSNWKVHPMPIIKNNLCCKSTLFCPK